MTIDRNTRVFYDASCLIAAAGSPEGGSGFLLSVCGRGLLQGVCSQLVLMEAERNIIAKLGAEARANYYRILMLTPFLIAPIPPEEKRQPLYAIVGRKDAHVVAAAFAIEAAFLLTLDKNLEAQVNQAGLPLRALSPGEFIKTFLPQHADYPSVREGEKENPE